MDWFMQTRIRYPLVSPLFLPPVAAGGFVALDLERRAAGSRRVRDRRSEALLSVIEVTKAELTSDGGPCHQITRWGTGVVIVLCRSPCQMHTLRPRTAACILWGREDAGPQ